MKYPEKPERFPGHDRCGTDQRGRNLFLDSMDYTNKEAVMAGALFYEHINEKTTSS